MFDNCTSAGRTSKYSFSSNDPILISEMEVYTRVINYLLITD